MRRLLTVCALLLALTAGVGTWTYLATAHETQQRFDNIVDMRVKLCMADRTKTTDQCLDQLDNDLSHRP